MKFTMKKFSANLTIAAMLMVVATVVSSATATLDDFKGSNIQGPAEGTGFLTLDFIGGLANMREIGVVDLFSDANKWRQTYSENGALEFVLTDYSSSTEAFAGGSGDGLVMNTGVSPDLSRVPFAVLGYRRVDNGVSASYQDSPAVPLPLPSAAWLFGSTLIAFVMLSTRRQV